MRRNFLILFTVSVALSGCVNTIPPQTPAAHEDATTLNSNATPENSNSASRAIVATSQSIDETWSNGTFKAEYPVFNQPKFDDVIALKISELKENAAAFASNPDFTSETVVVEIQTKVIQAVHGVDLLFTIYSNVMGTVHPNERVETLSLDADGNRLTADTLLANADLKAILHNLSNKLQAENPGYAISVEDYIAPTLENFRHAVRNSTGGIRIYFDEEYLPHAIGTVFIDVP